MSSSGIRRGIISVTFTFPDLKFGYMKSGLKKNTINCPNGLNHCVVCFASIMQSTKNTSIYTSINTNILISDDPVE